MGEYGDFLSEFFSVHNRNADLQGQEQENKGDHCHTCDHSSRAERQKEGEDAAQIHGKNFNDVGAYVSQKQNSSEDTDDRVAGSFSSEFQCKWKHDCEDEQEKRDKDQRGDKPVF